MLIQFKFRAAAPSGSPPLPVQTIELCAATDTLLSGFKHTWSRNVAVEEFFRGEAVQCFDRKNHKTEFSFTVVRPFPTVWQARQEMILKPSTFGSTVGYIQLHNSGAAASGVSLYCKGGLTVGECYHLGVTVFQGYTFVGGKVTTTAPTL